MKHGCLSFQSKSVCWKSSAANWNKKCFTVKCNSQLSGSLVFIKLKQGLVFNETLVSKSLDDAKSETRYLSMALNFLSNLISYTLYLSNLISYTLYHVSYMVDLSDEYGRVWLLAKCTLNHHILITSLVTSCLYVSI